MSANEGDDMMPDLEDVVERLRADNRRLRDLEAAVRDWFRLGWMTSGKEQLAIRARIEAALSPPIAPEQSDEERARELSSNVRGPFELLIYEKVKSLLAQARAEEAEAIERECELIAVDWRDGDQEQKWYAWEYLRAAIRAWRAKGSPQ